MENLKINLDEMVDFIWRAKINSFPDKSSNIMVENNKKRIYFSQNKWEYIDMYIGNLIDSGFEEVCYNSILI